MADLEALDLSTQLLQGPDVAELLWRRFNPSSADRAPLRATTTLELLDRLPQRQTTWKSRGGGPGHQGCLDRDEDVIDGWRSRSVIVSEQHCFFLAVEMRWQVQ